MTALKIMEVTPDMADAFMGASELDEGGRGALPRSREHDTGTRTVLFYRYRRIDEPDATAG